MPDPQLMNLGLIGVYAAMSLLYARQANMAKALYWAGATILATGVLLM